MKVFVLTQREFGDFDVPFNKIVGAVSNKAVAEEWKKRNSGNDFKQMTLDKFNLNDV